MDNQTQTFQLIQNESWPTKINAIFGLIWKVLLIFILVAFLVGSTAEKNLQKASNQEENFSKTYLDNEGLPLKNEMRNNLPQILLISIQGVIAEENIAGMLEPLQQRRSETLQKIQYVKNHPEIKGVILRINSPGGTVYDSDLIAEKIAELRKSGVKVIALLEEQATSGAYYIASQADLIIAHQLTITGSLGSIMELPNVEGLLQKVGVKFNAITSGDFKDMGSFYTTMRTEEKEIFQKMIEESYQRFLATVENGRKIKHEDLLKIADGRIYTGIQALDLKLIDILGRYSEAKSNLEKLLNLPETQVFELKIERNPYELFLESFGAVSAKFSTKTPVDFVQSLNLQNRLFYL